MIGRAFFMYYILFCCCCLAERMSRLTMRVTGQRKVGVGERARWTRVRCPQTRSVPRSRTTSFFMPSLPAIASYLFALSALLVGFHNLTNSTAALASLSLPQSALPAAQGNALAAIAMGLYYALAARQENRAFFALSVPMRMLTATVFWSHGGTWRIAALWEGGSAAATATALGVERWRRKGAQRTLS
jgi:hypothetical protein